MESLGGLMMGLGAGFGVVMLLVIAALFAVLWVVTRRKLTQTVLLLAEKEAELELKSKDRDQLVLSTQAQVSKLKERIRVLSDHTYLTEFDPDHVYTLAAKAEAQIEGMRTCFGLVREDDRALVPFVTHGGLEEMHVGDKFSLVGGRLTGIAPVGEGISPKEPLASPRVSKDGLKHGMVAASTAGEPNETILFRPAGESLAPEDYYKGLPCLKVLEGKDREALFFLPFTQGKIGRDRTNTVALDDERSSRIHAFIDYRDHNFVLRDNHSTNGTYHNGNQIEEAKLNFGDIITIGNTKMVFTSEGYEIREKAPEEAIELFEKCLSVEPNFILGLKYLAFLLERDVRRQGESDPIYAKLKRLEQPA